jgi:hypothetical protein
MDLTRNKSIRTGIEIKGFVLESIDGKFWETRNSVRCLGSCKVRGQGFDLV